MRGFLIAALTLGWSGVANAQGAICGSKIGPLVPDAKTAREIAEAIIGSHQNPARTKRYKLTVEADETGNGWVAYQRMPMKRATNGNLIVSAGGGGIGMHTTDARVR